MASAEIRVKLQTLVKQLASRTEAGRTRWAETDDLDAFRATMQGGMVRVGKAFAHDEDEGAYERFCVTILDKQGLEVEEYCSDGDGDELENLWVMARRSARGGIDVLDQLLKETA